MAKAGGARSRCSTSAPTRSTIAPGAFVVYHRHAWRPRRASRRRHPAGRGLHREVRPLREHRRPRAGWRCAPASRRATPARTGRSSARCPTRSAQPLPFDSLQQLRAALVAAHPHFAQLDQIDAGRRGRDLEALALQPATASARRRSSAVIADFYLTNPIARASAVMAECSALAQGRLQQAAE